MEVDSDKHIKQINRDTVHKICSGQVVLNLATAVKELVENSLDAGATKIDIRFKNYGTELIEVSDNGTGVTEDNFAALTLKYHTSKLREYADLLGVTSYGFRGEALSSLCSLSNLKITTRHQSAQYATIIEYDNKGKIIKKSPCSRQVGTTVSLTNLFLSLPVRQKEFHKNAKREFNKMTQLLYAYCLVSLGVKITCSNQTSVNSKSVVLATHGSMCFKDNIACVFGIKQLQSILEIKPEYVSNIKENIFKGLSGEIIEEKEDNIEDVEINLSEDSNDADLKDTQDPNYSKSQLSQGYKNVTKPIEFTGFISSCAHGSGRSSTDRQFYYINSRPCEPTKIMKIINEIYKQYNPNQYPFVFLNVNIERMSVDVNVTPDKRKIFLTKEKCILEVLKSSLLKLFESIPRTLKIDSTQNRNKYETKEDTDQPQNSYSFLHQFSNKLIRDNSVLNGKYINKKPDLKRKSCNMLDFVTAKTLKRPDTETHVSSIKSETCNEDIKEHIKDKEIILENKTENVSRNTSPEQGFVKTSDSIMYLEYTDKLPETQIKNIDDIFKYHTISCKTKSSSKYNNVLASNNTTNKVVTDMEDLGKYKRKSVIFKTSIEHVKQLANIYQRNKLKSIPDRVKFKSSINPVHNKKCEEELSREISKDSFKEMIVIGQFNLGFIITQLGDDLFIIDQHATDEIYNFEMLQKTTELTTQKLVVPQCLEMSGVNEQILMDNLKIFKNNGFTFRIDEQAPPTKRVHLLTIPMSKNWVFGKDDIEELLFMLRESSSEYCRPSRVRSMFASRACRKSVMIGTALSKSDMKKLVIHMAEIDKPWNCPHGRPTIRHLVNLAMIYLKQ